MQRGDRPTGAHWRARGSAPHVSRWAWGGAVGCGVSAASRRDTVQILRIVDDFVELSQ